MSGNVSGLGGVVPEGTPWTRGQNAVRLVWMLIGRPLFRILPGPIRNAWLRAFGARVGAGVKIARNVRIEIPWTLTLADGVRVNAGATLYSLGPIVLEPGVRVHALAHLCAGSHDFTSRAMRLTRPGIVVGARAEIGVDAFIGPGVRIGADAMVGARASVFTEVPAGGRWSGNPARPDDQTSV